MFLVLQIVLRYPSSFERKRKPINPGQSYVDTIQEKDIRCWMLKTIELDITLKGLARREKGESICPKDKVFGGNGKIEGQKLKE